MVHGAKDRADNRETEREKQSETDFQKNGRCDIGAAQSDGCARHS